MLPLKITILASCLAPPLLFLSPDFFQARFVCHVMAEEDLDYFWHSALIDWHVKIGICLIEQFAAHIKELHSCDMPSHREPPTKALFFTSHSKWGKAEPNNNPDTWPQKVIPQMMMHRGLTLSTLLWFFSHDKISAHLQFSNFLNGNVVLQFFFFVKLKYKPMSIFYIEEQFS